jgi:hypothetical protein
MVAPKKELGIISWPSWMKVREEAKKYVFPRGKNKGRSFI